LENEQKFNWDVRNFIVPVNAIEDFLILQHGDNATWDKMKVKAEEGNFVLYTMPSVDRLRMKRFFDRTLLPRLSALISSLNIVT
jgi:hypothetical protein